MKNEPQIIYLQLGEYVDASVDGEIEDFENFFEKDITWCTDNIYNTDIRYHHERYTPFCTAKGETLHIGDTVRKWIEDSVEPEGGYWWHATIEFHCGCLVLWQVGFDNYDCDENFPSLLYQEIESIELVKKYYEPGN